MKKRTGRVLCAATLMGMLAGSVIPVCAAENGDSLDPVTLHFIFYGDKKSATDEVWDAIADYTRDTLNCDYEIQFIAGSDYKDKLTVMAATGDVWDMNFDSNWTGITQMMAKDAYLNLDELLPEYAPDLYAKYEGTGVLASAKNKGHIVCLPWTQTMNNRPFFQWRGDLAEKAGIEVDKDNFGTWEDIDKLVYQMHEAYPDRYVTSKSQMISGGWAEVDADMGLYINLSDPECKITPAEEIPDYVTAMEYAEKWQKDGIIWKDVLNDQTDRNALLNEGKIITRWGTHEFAHSKKNWVEDGAYWDFVEVYKDDLYANRSPLANAMAISATSENPERTLMFLNQLETDQKLYDMVQYGIEGETYVLNGERAEYPEGMDGTNSNYMGWGGQWALWKPQYMRPTGGYTDNFWEEEAEYAASSDKNLYSPLEGFSFDATDVKTEVAQRNQIFGDAQKLLEVGLAGDTDTALEKIKTDSEGAGFQSVLDEYQRQIDEFLAAKDK